MMGESLSNSTTQNMQKNLGKYVVTFLEYVFEKEKARRCASAILKNLPLPKSIGRQRDLIADLVPEYPLHYWHALGKLKSMGVIKLDTARFDDHLGKGRYLKAYVFNEDFVKVLDKMATGFQNLQTGRKARALINHHLLLN
jgi:hypothetical protein